MQRRNSLALAVSVFVLALTFCLCVRLAWAHDLKFTGVKVRFEADETLVSVMAHAHNFAAGDDPAQEIPRRLQLRINGEAFVPARAQLVRDRANGIFLWQARAKGRAPRLGAAPQVALDAPVFPMWRAIAPS